MKNTTSITIKLTKRNPLVEIVETSDSLALSLVMKKGVKKHKNKKKDKLRKLMLHEFKAGESD